MTASFGGNLLWELIDEYLSSVPGPMPELDSVVSVTWPDYASVFIRREKEVGGWGGDDWVIVYHSLDNKREKHMFMQKDVEVCLSYWRN